jgi:hypothetical protein
MIDPEDALPIVRQAEELEISRATITIGRVRSPTRT